MPDKTVIDKILDVKGLNCPVPTMMTENALKNMKQGKTLKVVTSDITTKDSIPHLCTREGYDLIEMTEDNGLLCFIIRR
jgi:tRNA 2-thiouridine synthesizing protein A